MDIPYLKADDPFPPVDQTIMGGLLAFGGDLSVPRLLSAYREGIFPWYNESELIQWWCPEERMILLPDHFILSRSMQRICRRQRFTVKFDCQFREVITACSKVPREGQDGTWILPEMIDAYCALHEQGFAHSVECYEQEELVGGLYGVSLGDAFFGESMFSLRSNASKFALTCLVALALEWELRFIDCQLYTSHLDSLGAICIPRSLFLEFLAECLAASTRGGKWHLVAEQVLKRVPTMNNNLME